MNNSLSDLKYWLRNNICLFSFFPQMRLTLYKMLLILYTDHTKYIKQHWKFYFPSPMDCILFLTPLWSAIPQDRTDGMIRMRQASLRLRVPLSVCSASITASKGGGSIALARNWPIPPRRRSFMLRAISCNGVRNISGVMWVSSLGENKHKITIFFCVHTHLINKNIAESKSGPSLILPQLPKNIYIYYKTLLDNSLTFKNFINKNY